MNLKIKSKYIYLVTIEIEEECWHYKIGQRIKFIVAAGTNATMRSVMDNYVGSEYPSYRIINQERCGDDCFFDNRIHKNLLTMLFKETL